jgi:hypothetical protein
VLAELAVGIPNTILIITVAAGVGIFLAIAFLREVSHFKLKYLLLVFYAILFILSIFVPKDFLPIAFDSGGATTGSMTVPFIMALGIGITVNQKSKGSKDNKFGLIAICSIGPILTVMVLGMLYVSGSDTAESAVGHILYVPGVTESILVKYLDALLRYLLETFILLAPIVIVFLIFKFIALKISLKTIVRILKGIFYTFAGLVLFLAGASVGFLPAGNIIGSHFAGSGSNWLLIVAGTVFGYFIISAEPAVVVLNKQVAKITNGLISYNAMKLSLSVGVALAVGVSMLRVVTGLHIMWILLPGYILSIGLSFIVPKIFTSIAFDSGGVASGPLTSAFLLPMAMGASASLGGNMVTDAFGLIAMVAMAPLITIQIMGLYFTVFGSRKKERHSVTSAVAELREFH